jgi:penicillin-binding protein activator
MMPQQQELDSISNNTSPVKTNRTIFPPFLAALFLAGCASPTRYVDPGSGQGVNPSNQITTQDWGQAAEKMINSLLKSPALESTDGRRMVIMVGEIKNATREYIETDLLVKKIRVAVNRSGKVITTTAVRAGGPEDASSTAVRELRQSREVDQSTVPGQGQIIAPDYSLSGKIIETPVRAGNVRQSTFSFQLALTDVRNGLAPWEDEVEITKMGKRPAVSW